MLSDDFLLLTAQATTPATAANAYTITVRNGSNTLPTQNQGPAIPIVWRQADDAIYFRDSRGSGGTLSIIATPLGGGALTTSEQASLSNALEYLDHAPSPVKATASPHLIPVLHGRRIPPTPLS